MAIIIGHLRDFKWADITFRPTKDGEAEVQPDSSEYESERSPNGDFYSTESSIIGYVQQECVMTATEYFEFKKKQDGTSRAGTATMANGDVISMNCIIEGEHILSGGKITIKLAGKVRLQ